MRRIRAAFSGDGLAARVLRSASWMMLGFGAGQGLRLASNLILTRLLFPEAFGLMALINLVMMGLAMLSDVGLGAAITRSPRGDDPEFLNTAWTLRVIRGFLLWGLTAALAWPVAEFYAEPDLALYLPVSGLALIVAGFLPTRVDTANRHLLVGRVTALNLLAQAIGIASMVLLAWQTGSVIALVVGNLVQEATRLALMHVLLPGPRNRFRWEASAAHELIHFGKWIFFSTAFWFVSSQSDRAILGKFLPLHALGLYNIGYFLASFPYQLALSVNQRLMMPVYRDRPAQDSPENFRRQRQMRSGLTALILGLLIVMAFAGPALVDLLYDDRYAGSGHVVTLVACALMPAVIGMTYEPAALVAGDSRSYAIFQGARAIAKVALMLAGVATFGVFGAIAAMGAASILVYPLLVRIARRHHVWDWKHDLFFGLVAAGAAAAALSLHRELLTDPTGLI